MKVYLAYRYTGEDQKQLRDNLTQLSNVLTGLGHKSFICHRDLLDWGNTNIPGKELLNKSLAELKSSDVLLAFINNFEKSEGQLLEVGYAKAFGKRIVTLVQKNVSLGWLEIISDKIIEFSDIYELDNLEI
jgi:nucleoside 2-deoxyribosyltransferase